MDVQNIEEKYKKLATEYSKVKSPFNHGWVIYNNLFFCVFFSFQVRAQANVLKRAVLEEQNKNSALRESFRLKETNLRRVEQELDSLNFRNKQLEYRVASLQDDLSNVGKNSKTKNKSQTSNASSTQQNQIESSSVLSEEFQKKIFECAQLTSNLSDKTTEIQLQSNRIEELEMLIRSMNAEQTEIEAKLRKEVERLTVKTHELEARVTEGSSIVGSDDTLYVSECEQQQKFINNHCNNSANHSKLDERLTELEKEVVYWRSQCELLKVTDKLNDLKSVADGKQEKIEHEKTPEKFELDQINDELTPREKMITEHYTKKVEELFMSKCLADSKLALYIEEVNK